MTLDPPDPDRAPLLRQMSRVAGALYVSAAVLVAGSLLVAGELHGDPRAAAVIAALGFVAGIGWIAVGERVPVPAWVHVPSALAGTILVGLLVVAGGPTFAGVYGILFIYVVAFGFFYLSRPVAIAQVVIAAAVYGAALWQVREPGWAAHWLIVVGASAVGAGLIAALGHRANELLEREHRIAVSLAEMNEARDLFLRMVAHDLRSPMATIVGAAETIATRLDDLGPEATRGLARRQAAQGRRLARLVDDLLDTERLRSRALQPERRRVRLDQVIGDSLGLVESNEHPLEVDLEAVEAVVDPTLVERAVDNLVANAIDHTPAGTPVSVRLTRSRDGADIAVEDRGPGVPDPAKDTVFDLFTHGSAGGTGIGLALVREVVTAHGGECSVQDRPGGGASFHVWLPEDADARDGRPAARGSERSRVT